MAIHEMKPFSEAGAAGSHPGKRQRLRHGVFILPSFFTVLNLFCGYYAILETFRGGVADMDYAARAIGFAILFDAVDGPIARALHTSSDFGKQFDSLADIVSFGIAPAFLAFAWGVRGVMVSQSQAAAHVVQLGWFACFAFVICCAWRLARYNIGAAGGQRYFIGLQTPAAAGMIAATVHAMWNPIEDWRKSLIWVFAVLILGYLMTSKLRYYRGMNLGRQRTSIVVVGMALLVALIFKYSEATLFMLAILYISHGIVIELLRKLRHHPAPST
jgi:CDP-diacylglycerol---serine O-phosphatidyltransferase